MASGAQVADKSELAAVQGEDKLVLQSYGRPYKYEFCQLPLSFRSCIVRIKGVERHVAFRVFYYLGV